jgi:hypothetical protein
MHVFSERGVHYRGTGIYGCHMVYINIPYVVENDRIDRTLTTKELQVLTISETAKQVAFDAIYNKLPRGLDLEDGKHASMLEEVLSRLGVPYRRSNEAEYKSDSWS